MSLETILDLNTNVLIGNTDNRGHAWHYKASAQGDEPNHYPLSIPVEDVRRRLFGWVADSRRVAVEVPATFDDMTHTGEDGTPLRWAVQDNKQAITRSDTNHVMGMFSPGYKAHQYDEWLLTQVANILDGDIGISSAGLLKGGAVAWVEVSVPESVTTPEGVVFRPNLLATTSFDGSIATTYKRTITDTVCDNTREAALAEKGQTAKVRHSRYSQLKLAEARDALAMINTAADDFAAEVAALCATDVTTRQWNRFLDVYVPMTDQVGKHLAGKSLTIATNKRDALAGLYASDARVAPWAGTAHGVLQAVNTWEHYGKTVRGESRADRNMLRTIEGQFGDVDRDVYATLTRVLVAA